MSNKKEPSQQTADSSKRKGSPNSTITRRGIVIGGTTLVGVAAVGIASAKQSNAQQSSPTTSPERSSVRRFDGKVVLITGATSGIGRVTANAFAREGAKVMFCGRREQLGREVEAEIKKAGGEARYMRADVSRPEQVEAFVNACVKNYGRIDIAFNNAGIGTTDGAGTTHHLTLDHWREQHAINLDGVFYALKYEIPVMLRQGGGRIINTASTMGLVALPGNPAYVSSKHGVVGLTKAVALEYATRNIRVNAVAPGPIDTPFIDQFFSGSQEVQKRRLIAQLNDKVPVKRRGRPEEIARVVMFLASDDSSFMAGEIVTVDGGMGAHEGSAAGEG